MAMKIVLAAVLGLLTSSLAWADRMGPNGDKFYESAAHFENACGTGECKAPFKRIESYNVKTSIDTLDAKIKVEMKKVANDQAEAWGDTILEGDYYSSGRTRLDSVSAYYKGKTLVGYKITYSEKAWFVGDCKYDGSRESLKGCKEGRIVEVSYVSPDFLTYFSDEERYAEFSFASN